LPHDEKAIAENLKIHSDYDIIELRLLRKNQLIEEIRSILNTVIHQKSIKGKYFLLMLDLKEKQLTVTAYNASQVDKANAKYNQLEEQKIANTDIVLVSADSFQQLKKAYPNYFGDVKKFLDILKKELKSYQI